MGCHFEKNGTCFDSNFAYYLPNLPNDLSFPVYGILCPIVAIMTLISNILVVCVFMTKKMRSVTTVFLASLAGSDTLSAILWSLVHLVFYAKKNYGNYPILYPHCMFHDFALYLAVIFHTTSVWLTMTLGLQRCIIVVKPFKGPRLWTIKKSSFIAVMTYLVPLIFFSPLFFMKHYRPIFLRTGNETYNATTYCATYHTEMFNSKNEFLVYSITYHIFRGVFIQLIPCLLMIISTAILANKIRHERVLLQRSVSRIGDGQRKDHQHRQRTTLMVVIIMLIFLFVEIPNAIVFSIKFYESFAGHIILEEAIDYPFAILHNFVLLLSYQGNFWIYIGLSARFRKTLQQLLFGFRIKKTVEEVFSMSSPPSYSSSTNRCNVRKAFDANGDCQTDVSLVMYQSQGSEYRTVT